jgi:type II secretory pathway predicted ATPase ExeA
MYERFYGLNRKPFSLTPDPDFLYLSKQHSHALATLRYGLMTGAGITVITGEVGSGKTTLIRRVMRQLDVDSTVGLITNTHRGFRDLLGWMLGAYGVKATSKDPVLRYNQFVAFLAQQKAKQQPVILMIDEAQNLNPAQLEELRLLSNLNLAEGTSLQLILVGQPELGVTLSRHDLRQFSQRIAVEYEIQPLDHEQTSEYIIYRLGIAGGSPETFDADARSAVYFHSRGIPRLINNICDLGLVYGFGEARAVIGIDVIQTVMQGKRISRHRSNNEKAAESVVQDVRFALKERTGIDVAAIAGYSNGTAASDAHM